MRKFNKSSGILAIDIYCATKKEKNYLSDLVDNSSSLASYITNREMNLNDIYYFCIFIIIFCNIP